MKIDSSKPSKQQSKTAQEIKKKYESGERDFRNLDLRGESFAEFNLSGANFADCNLREADFTNCDLTGTNFAKARLAKAKLHRIKAGSENDDTKYAWFFFLLLAGVVVTIRVIYLLLNSRQDELILINKNANSFLSLAILVPVGYSIHLSQSSAMISQVFWGLGILAFWLKTFDQPLSGLLGNLLFWVLAGSLLSPLYMFWISKSWRNLGKLVWNYPILIILSFLSICCVLLSFFRVDSSAILSFFHPDSEAMSDNWLLVLSIVTLSLPVIPSLFFSLAAYSTLFDADKIETYRNIFKAFFRVGLSGLALLIAYLGTQEILNKVYPLTEIYCLIILLSIIVFLEIIFSKILRPLQAKKWSRLKCLLFWGYPTLFWGYFWYREEQYKGDLTSLDQPIKIITAIMIVFSLSFFVLLTYNFSTLSFKSKRSAKWLGWWYFFSLALPSSIISMPIISPSLSTTDPWSDWKWFFLPVLIIWFLFLLSVSVFDIHNLGVKLINKIKKSFICRFLHMFWFTLFVLIPSYLALASLIIIVFLINYWLESGDLDFYSFSDISELFFLLLSGFFLVLAVLSFIFWGILLLTKSKIAETKQQAFETQKIKSQYSGFRDLAVSFRCIDSTNFGQANLIEADFGNSDVTGVNFRGARLKRTIWTKAKGLECAAIGNSYLKYPKVRNWVVRVGNDKIVGGDIRNGN